MRASLTLRWARALTLGLVVLASGAIAHASAGGLLVGPVGMVLLYGAVSAGCAAILGREASRARLVAVMVGGQGFVHTILAATAGHAGDHSMPGRTASSMTGAVSSPVAPWDPRSGESYDRWAAHAFGAGGTSGLAVPSWLTHAISDMAAHPLMAFAHVAAAVLVGFWLAVGERALWTLLRIAANTVGEIVRWAADRLSGLPAFQQADLRHRRLSGAFLVRPPLLSVWSRGPARRGPPQVLLAR